MRFLKEFSDFLKEYKVLALAIAFIIGSALTSLVQSLVNDILMPILTFFIPQGQWKEATFNIGTIAIKYGSFLSAVLNFVIIALIVFIIAKKIMKEEKVSKK
ncbi:MAG: large conductance mechanosensitive channel protein MscL [Candidatus Aenigmarchaeota archaeon]|nr:large conductance mechanosensitive channel protein MscL [Candidatus Aenigmarchaeota archaeon]MBU5689067.1 large conductance mechanosensitive channel protein MscL [Candidatus Aenigmarchaeota archaeon]